jgi:hypothetical protein
MAQCLHCGAKLELESSTPLCVPCRKEKFGQQADLRSPMGQIRNRLQKEERIAREESHQLLAALREMTADLPSEIPYPDNSERIRQASESARRAQQKYAQALQRLMDFRMNGIIPEDLKD